MQQETKNAETPTTIDLTPTWESVLSWYLTVLQDGNDEGKKIAKDELLRMAKAADQFNIINKLVGKSVITATQYDSLKNAIYNALLDSTETEDGFDMGEMGNCMDAADLLIKEWMSKEGVTILDETTEVSVPCAGQFRDFMVKFNGNETPLSVLIEDNKGHIENGTLVRILSLQVGEKCFINNGAAGIDEFERVEDLDNSEPTADNFVSTKVKEIKERVAKNKTALVSTCDARNWNLEEHLHMPAVAEELRKQGYVVNVKVNYGVTDYGISFSGSKSV